VPKPPGTPAGGAGGLGHADVMRAVDAMLDNSFIVIADTSLSMFPAASLNIRRRDGFLCNAVWQSIGYSVAASVGVAMAEPQLRPLVLCGDGGFQMTAQALSTLARRRLRAIVVVLDNASYAIEQYVIEKVRRVPPTSSSSYFSNPSVPLIPFLGLAEWDYAMLAKAMGFTFAETAATADELSGALTSAKSAQGPALIAVKVKKRDLPAELWPS
jgi:indolepyruvate decarboxylase